MRRCSLFHALVAVKQVPDTTNIRIDPETGNLVREGVPAIMNPYDAHALAAAVSSRGHARGRAEWAGMAAGAFKDHDLRYFSHSIGRSCFLAVLHSLQAATTLPLPVLPPREMGTT